MFRTNLTSLIFCLSIELKFLTVEFESKKTVELNEEAQEAVREIGAAINAAIERSTRVSEAIERLRNSGYEMQLTLRLEIGLREIDAEGEEFSSEEDFRLELTDEDVRTLRRMKIRLDPEE
jgi:hypothetical protein